MIEKKYRVALADTDAAGRVYFASCLEWFHRLWEEYLEQKNLPISKIIRGEFHLPIVHTEFNYKISLALGDNVTLKIIKITPSQKSFTVYYQTLTDQSVAIEGHFTHVCIAVRTAKPIPIPQELKNIF